MTYEAAIPSPTWQGFTIGPLTIHAYALCIIAGIFVALWLTNRRWTARGGSSDDLWTIAMWTIPAGIIGGRLYHVFSTPAPYFGPGGNPVAALYIWNGGLGIWGAVALGVLAAYFVARSLDIRFGAFLDAAAPGLLLAQGIGRWGNWFNQELFGAPTTLPWGLRIDQVINGRLNPNWPDPSIPADTLFHPTFLYESIWNILGAFLLIWLGKRFRLDHGQVFFAYICYYTLGRVWIEYLRIDTAEHIFGVRLNVWTSILVFLLGAVLFIASRMRHPHFDPDITLSGSQGGADSRGGARGSRAAAAEPAGASSVPAALPKQDTAGEQIGFGPVTQALPIIDDPEEEENPFSSRSFGYFGAVTSTISIVPQVSPQNKSRKED